MKKGTKENDLIRGELYKGDGGVVHGDEHSRMAIYWRDRCVCMAEYNRVILQIKPKKRVA
jgi:hypothetical protein